MNFPITIRSSPRALLAKYSTRVAFWLLALIGLLFISVTAIKVAGGATLALLLAFWLFKAFFEYLRIKNTTYTVYSDKIQEESYLFRFLGAKNSTINLKQIRQIEGFSNTRLDVLLFGCGGVTLTVSGDLADFTMENLFAPMRSKALIEQVCFGSSGTNEAQKASPL